MSRTARRIIVTAVAATLLSLGGVTLVGASQDMDRTMTERQQRQQQVEARTEPGR